MKAVFQGLTAAILTAALAVPAVAGDRGEKRGHSREWREHQRDNRHYNKDRRHQQQAYSKGYRDAQRNYRGDYSRGYYGNDRSYNNGYYRQANNNNRYTWGSNGRINCKRDDGTTGLIVGALAGGTLGNVIAQQGDKRIGSVLGGTLGAVLGKEVSKGSVRCR